MLFSPVANDFDPAIGVAYEDRREADRQNQLRADLAYLEYPAGGAVFSTSSISWISCLAMDNYANNVSRLTENVLRRFASDAPLPAPQHSTAAANGAGR